MRTAKDFYLKIKSEDELPSGTGWAFRNLLDEVRNPVGCTPLGCREIQLIADWINDYLDMPERETNKLIRLLRL